MIHARIDVGRRTFRLGKSVDLSLPLDFGGPQPNAYGVPPAQSRAYSGEGFILDTRLGGSCNCDVIEMIPHCHGTHTECVGHVTLDRFSITHIFPEPFLPCSLVSVLPHGREIVREDVATAVAAIDPEFRESLVIRTLPNSPDKRTRHWLDSTTPYLTTEAMAVIRGLGVRHLLIDLPSVDPLVDGGNLAAHRIYWELPPASTTLPNESARLCTITEMIYVPDEVPDGSYLLTIQMPRFMTDAVPSRPILFFLETDS